MTSGAVSQRTRIIEQLSSLVDQALVAQPVLESLSS
jgi:hypothetical protein